MLYVYTGALYARFNRALLARNLKIVIGRAADVMRDRGSLLCLPWKSSLGINRIVIVKWGRRACVIMRSFER